MIVSILSFSSCQSLLILSSKSHRKEKFRPSVKQGVTLELVKLETAVQEIHENLLLRRSKEANIRDVSEKTNARITWLSIMSLGVCIVVSVLLLCHQQWFFQKKKLI